MKRDRKLPKGGVKLTVVARVKAPTERDPFEPLEVGDVLVLGNGETRVGTIEVVGLPSESNRPLGVKLKAGEHYPMIPLPPEERKTGFYTFRNIDAFDGPRTFCALYTGNMISASGRVSNYIFNILEVIRT